MEYKLYHKAPYDDIERYGGLMGGKSSCRRFLRRYGFEGFSMADFQSCGKCRHFGSEDRCKIK